MPTDEPGRDRSGRTPPVMPSFESLRGPRRRSPVDVLVPGEMPAGAPAEPRPPGRPADAVRPAAPRPPAPPRPPADVPRPAGPRPPEWADLLSLGVHVAEAVMAGPIRVARRSVCVQLHQVRRLLGA